jgi:gluconate 2-dehydrogenase gamma chain
MSKNLSRVLGTKNLKMKRRDSLKALALTTFGVGVSTAPSKAENIANTEGVFNELFKDKDSDKPGSTDEEKARDRKLKLDKFFTPTEMKMVTVLGDIIVPADGISGSASQAGVPAFIEFIVKDKPEMQTPMRGGLKWMDVQCLKMFEKTFLACSSAQQIQLIDLIAYPKEAKREYSQGVKFFSLIRNLTMTGFYTSQMGINDIGYVGNTPNNWDGAPQDVLDKYGLSYE